MAAAACGGNSATPGTAPIASTFARTTIATPSASAATTAAVSCQPVADWERPATNDLLDALSSLGVQLTARQRAASRDNVVACDRMLTFVDILHDTSITVAGDPGRCHLIALLGEPTEDPQATPSPNRSAIAVCHP